MHRSERTGRRLERRLERTACRPERTAVLPPVRSERTVALHRPETTAPSRREDLRLLERNAGPAERNGSGRCRPRVCVLEEEG